MQQTAVRTHKTQAELFVIFEAQRKRSIARERRQFNDGSQLTDASAVARAKAQAAYDAEFVAAQSDGMRPGEFDDDTSNRHRVTVGADLEAEAGFPTFGHQLEAVRAAALSPSETSKKLLHINAEARATGASEGVPSDGGFLLQKRFESKILEKMHAEGTVAGAAFNVPLGAGFNGIEQPFVHESSRATGSRSGGVQGYWISEGVAPTKSKAKLGLLKMDLEKLGALHYATDELTKDVQTYGTFAQELFAKELRFMNDDALINGDGAGKPQGILNANALVTVPKLAGQSAATVKYENIVAMSARMHALGQTSYVWYVNMDVTPQLRTMTLAIGTGGSADFLPAGGASGSPFDTLFGRPILPIEQCSTVGTVGDIIAADMSQYVMITKDIEAASSIHVKFIESEVAFRTIYRINGQSWWSAALTPYKGSNAISPFVVLATRD